MILTYNDVRTTANDAVGKDVGGQRSVDLYTTRHFLQLLFVDHINCGFGLHWLPADTEIQTPGADDHECPTLSSSILSALKHELIIILWRNAVQRMDSISLSQRPFHIHTQRSLLQFLAPLGIPMIILCFKVPFTHVYNEVCFSSLYHSNPNDNPCFKDPFHAYTTKSVSVRCTTRIPMIILVSKTPFTRTQRSLFQFLPPLESQW